MKETDEKVLRKKLYDGMIRNIPDSEYKQIKEKVEALLLQNDEVLDTLDVRILTSDYDDLAVLLNILVVYPDIQSKIIALRQNEYKMFVSIIKGMDKAGVDWISIAEDLIANLDGQNYRRLFEEPRMVSYVNRMYNRYASDKVNEISSSDIETLESMVSLFTNGNMFNLKSYADIKKLDRAKIYDNLLIGNIEDDYMSKLSSVDKLKNVILLKRFGHSLDVAMVIYNRYLSDYDGMMDVLNKEDEKEIRKYLTQVRGISDPQKIKREVSRILKENSVIKSYISTLKTILEENDIEKLKEYYAESNVTKGNYIYRLDSYIRKFFCREKNKSFYVPNVQDVVTVDSRSVYLIQDDFKISMSSLDSYSKAWDLDVKKIKNHALCTNICANNNLNHAPIRGACIAFNDYDERSLYASSPWDLGSADFANSMNISNMHRDNERKKLNMRFYLPNAQIDRVRRRSGEDLYERRELDSSKIDYTQQKFKKQPAYVVYFSEESVLNYLKSGAKDIVEEVVSRNPSPYKNPPDKPPKEVLTSENLRKYLDMDKLNDKEYRTKLIEQYAKNDLKWSNPDPEINDTLKEAAKRNVDIVIVDRTYTALKERLKIDEIERQIVNFDVSEINNSQESRAKFINLIRRMIVESENCRAGLNIVGEKEDGDLRGKLIHKELRETLFSREIMSDRLNKIENKIAALNVDIQKECYKDLAEIVRDEIVKYDASWFEVDPGFKMRVTLNEYIAKATDSRTFSVQDALNEVDDRTGKSGGQLVCEAIADAMELDEYPSSMTQIHGQKHINNVILFSYLIAKGENTLDSDGIDLLIQSAKFHDVGRDGRWNGLGEGKRHDSDEIPHAEPSALAAEYYMMKENNPDGSKKYSKEQIAIVQTAIAYHEVHEFRHNVFDEAKFSELCNKYGVADKDKEQAKRICIYLKDADAVDRTRFMYSTDWHEINTIPEHRKFERKHWNYGIDTSYLRTLTSLTVLEEAKKIHFELMKRGAEAVYDKDGHVKPQLIDAKGQFKVNSPLLDTKIIDMLKPYETVMEDRAPKYKTVNSEESDRLIEVYLDKKNKELENKEQQELLGMFKSVEKGFLAKIRSEWEKIVQRFRSNNKEK